MIKLLPGLGLNHAGWQAMHEALQYSLKRTSERERDADLENAKETFLRQRGWVHTCDNASSSWLWQKALPDGRIVLVSRDTAVSLQAQADAISMKHWPKPEKVKP